MKIVKKASDLSDFNIVWLMNVKKQQMEIFLLMVTSYFALRAVTSYKLRVNKIFRSSFFILHCFLLPLHTLRSCDRWLLLFNK